MLSRISLTALRRAPLYTTPSRSLTLSTPPVQFIPAPSSSAALIPSSISSIASSILSELSAAIWLLKRTFQPSLLRRKRKHGFLSRLHDRNGRKTLNRRLEKGRRSLSA